MANQGEHPKQVPHYGKQTTKKQLILSGIDAGSSSNKSECGLRFIRRVNRNLSLEFVWLGFYNDINFWM